MNRSSHVQVEESDDEDLCALSDRWRYQHNNRQWARLDATSSSSSAAAITVDDDVTANPNCPSQSQQRSSPSYPSVLSSSTKATLVDDVLKSASRSVVGNGVADVQQSSNGVGKRAMHFSLRASSSSPIPKPAAVHHRRSGSSSGLPSSVSTSRSTEFVVDDGVVVVVNGVSSSSPSTSSKDLLAVVAPMTCATSLSDSERSSCGSSSSTSVSPGQPRRAPSDRFRGAWNILKKVENHLMTRRSSGSRRGVSTTAAAMNDCNGPSSDRQMEIGSPTMVETAAVRAKLDSLRCVEINRLMPTSPPSGSSSIAEVSVTPTSPSPSGCAFDLTPKSSASPSTISVESCDSTSSAPQQQQFCSRTLPNPRHQRHRVHNGHAANSFDDSTAADTARDVVAPLLSRRNQRSLLLGVAENSPSGSGSGPSAGSQANATRISVYDNVSSGTPCVSSMTTLTLPSPNALVTFQDATASTLTDAERELDAILSSLYQDISWLSRTLAVVAEERDTGLKC